MTAAEWLNQTFYAFDEAIFSFTNDLLNAVPFLRYVARFISYLGDEGILFIILAAVLLVFRKTRKIGILLAFCLIFNHIINNMILKHLIARPRPFAEDGGVDLFRQFWESYGDMKQEMTSYSFPSGHTSMAMAIGGGLFLMLNKKYSWAFLILPLLMAWSRVALFVHYPSDVVFGLLTGTLSLVAAFFIVKLIFKIKFVENLCTGDKLF